MPEFRATKESFGKKKKYVKMNALNWRHEGLSPAFSIASHFAEPCCFKFPYLKKLLIFGFWDILKHFNGVGGKSESWHSGGT